MKSRIFAAFVFLFSVTVLAGCSGGSDDQSQNGARQDTVQLLGPTPSLAGSVEVGNTIPLVPLRPAVTSASSVSVTSASPHLLAQAATATSSDSSLEPISQKNPIEILGADRVVANPWQAKNLNDLKLVTLPNGERTRMPTGKWSKGFFYQSPRNIDAYFQFNGVPDDPRNQGGDTNEFNIFAYPNKLNLDDRIGMLSVSFASRRYISYGLDPKADVYDLSNPLKTDTINYPIAPNNSQDIRLSYVQPAEGRLPRQVDRYDELTIASSWITPAGDKSMQVIAAEGSPYVTVSYKGLRPVIQVGQGNLPRTARDKTGGIIQPANQNTDYTQQESDNAIQAVAVGEDPLKRFTEFNESVTPTLTGTKFRFVYQLADYARAMPGTNDLTPITPVQILREMVLYASRPITLEWDKLSRSYIASDATAVVLRTALVDDVLYDPDPTKISDIPSFKVRRAILDRYAVTFPTSSELFIEYDNQVTGTVTYRWKTERMDGQPAQDSDLLMMAFDATHTPSLQNAKVVDGIAYRSNFGMMSGIAGSEWKQKLAIPSILRNGAPPSEFWMGTGAIKSKVDIDRIKTSLEADTKLLTTDFLTTCNTDSYICGQYLHNVARLALIAHSLNELETRDKLITYLKKTMRLWLDGFDPNGVKVSKPAENKDNDMFLYDSTNGGTITSLGLQDPEKDYSNRTYVDHMFHYGYFIYAASVIAQLDDPKDAWLAANQEKVNLLVRDIANPSLGDKFFPIVRTFDWFRMQNIADAGPDANGGNTESSSESINSNYALVAWGVVTKNNQFQALAAIMAAAEIRTAQAFYQITPDTAYLKYIEHPEGVSVKVQAPNGDSESRTIRLAAEPVMNIVRSNLTETNTFFGPLLIYRIGINLLPITPISEFVISPAWARVHAATLRELEGTHTKQFDDIVNAVPSESSPCFKAAWSPPGPHLDKKTGMFVDPPPPGNACAGKLRVLYSWRQLAVAGVGITDPTGAYQRYVGYMDALENQQKIYKQNTRSDIHPGSSELREGIDADVLKDNSTPSTNTNTLWWLASRKPG